MTALDPIYMVIEIPTLLLIFVAIYANGILYRHRHERFAQKRSILITVGLNIALCLAMISRSLGVLTSIFQFMPYYIAQASNSYTTFLILYFLNVRNWIIYYNYHHSYYTSQSEWAQIIDPTLNEKEKQNWFIKNKAKYGNLSYIMKLFGIILILTFIICSIGVDVQAEYQESSNDENFFDLIAFIPLVVTVLIFLASSLFYVVIVCKTPRFR